MGQTRSKYIYEHNRVKHYSRQLILKTKVENKCPCQCPHLVKRGGTSKTNFCCFCHRFLQRILPTLVTPVPSVSPTSSSPACLLPQGCSGDPLTSSSQPSLGTFRALPLPSPLLEVLTYTLFWVLGIQHPDLKGLDFTATLSFLHQGAALPHYRVCGHRTPRPHSKLTSTSLLSNIFIMTDSFLTFIRLFGAGSMFPLYLLNF